jgi:hypothetical protein
VPGGRDIPVTNENRVEYIHRIAHYRLNTQIRRQCAAFLRGFSALIKPEWLRMFNQHELHLLIAGRQGGIDLIDLRQVTQPTQTLCLLSFWALTYLIITSPHDATACTVRRRIS